jgi:hypothetical protein
MLVNGILRYKCFFQVQILHVHVLYPFVIYLLTLPHMSIFIFGLTLIGLTWSNEVNKLLRQKLMSHTYSYLVLTYWPRNTNQYHQLNNKVYNVLFSVRKQLLEWYFRKFWDRSKYRYIVSEQNCSVAIRLAGVIGLGEHSAWDGSYWWNESP